MRAIKTAMSRATSHGFSACLLSLILVVACSSSDDRAFRIAVKDALVRVALFQDHMEDLEVRTYFGNPEFEQRAARAIAVADSFKTAVVNLPHPTSKNLRFVAVSLGVVGETAADVVTKSIEEGRVGFRYVEYLQWHRWNSPAESTETMKRYRESFLALQERLDGERRLSLQIARMAAIERQVLGSSIIRDHLLTLATAHGDERMNSSATDSLIEAQGAIVKIQLSEFR